MYFQLITKKFTNIPNQILSEDEIIEILDDCYKNCAFSIFPYLFNVNSEQAIEKYNSGDCVALSIYIKNKLKKMNIQSYLIPATIPNKYKLEGYLEISHVALCIPLSSKKFYVVDPAFYLLNPMIVDLSVPENENIVYSKNIYKNEEENKLINYTTIDKIKYNLKFLDKNEVFNKYQTIPSNTYYIQSFYTDDILDSWKYFLIEIMNPDEAITTFFVNIKKTPFITTTISDDNGVLTLNDYILIEDDYIKIKHDNKTEIIDKNDLTLDTINRISEKLHKFLHNENFKDIYNSKFENIYIKDD